MEALRRGPQTPTPPLHPSYRANTGSILGGEGGRGGDEDEAYKAGGDLMVSAGRTRPSLIIGLGNTLRGDDGVGPAVVGRLRRLGCAPGVRLIESDGSDLAEVLASAADGRVIVIDAAELGLAPGVWIRLPADRIRRGAATGGHARSLAEALDLLAAIGVRPRSLEVFAVQPERDGWGPGLSRPVRRAARRLAEEIRCSLARPDGSPAGKVIAPERDELCLLEKTIAE